MMGSSFSPSLAKTPRISGDFPAETDARAEYMEVNLPQFATTEMKLILPTPSVATVTHAATEFDQHAKYGISDRALTQLVTTYPGHSEVEHVLLKVVALNALYSTSILDVVGLAQHITRITISPLVAVGAPEAIDLIANWSAGGKPRRVFSFASKYCSWHNPRCYPIFDSFVERALGAYRRRDSFAQFGREDLRNGLSFVRVVTSFRDHYNLHGVGFKNLDKFLWQVGKSIDP